MKPIPQERDPTREAEQMAQVMAEAMSTLPPQAQFGFLQQIIGAATLTQMLQEQRPA